MSEQGEGGVTGESGRVGKRPLIERRRDSRLFGVEVEVFIT